MEAMKKAILHSQYQAAKGVNKIQLSLYYAIGQYVSANSRHGHWGKHAIDTISLSLQRELPGLRGFSSPHIRSMRLFYETWSDVEDCSPLASKIDTNVLIRKCSPLASGISMDEFFGISFTHHMEIIRQTTSLEERAFYIHQTYLNHWSKYALRDHLKADDFHHRGMLPNNFSRAMADSHQALKAVSMFKDEYLLDFINVEQLDEQDREDIDERVVETSIVNNIKKFVMMFGRGFAFIGNQYRLMVGEKEFFVDLLFYNREISSLVAIELKAGEFKPSYLGQLNFYLQALDDQVRMPGENPSIGLVLCKNADKMVAEYAVRDYTKPMGVATYRTTKDMPKKLRDALPDIEELKKLL